MTHLKYVENIISDIEFENIYEKAKWYSKYYKITLSQAIEIIKICIEKRREDSNKVH